MTNRVDKGWQLYRQGAVKVDYIADDQMHFHVQSSSSKETHAVSMLDDTWNCSCPDFYNRNDRESTKQLICKHIHGAIFKMAEINGLHVLEQIQEQQRQLTKAVV